MNSSRVVVLLGLLLSVSGCKIEITVPLNGQVETESGAYTCAAGDTCVIDVVDVFFDEVFIAKPAPGYSFSAWRTKRKALCGGKQASCPLSTTSFPDTSLMQFLESDATFFLEPVFGKPNTWSQIADLPKNGDAISSCVIRGKIYAIGLAHHGETGDRDQQVEEYDPLTDTWTRKADMPTPRGWATASAVNNKCYVFGGYPGVQTTAEEYNPRTDSWRSISPMPEGRVVAASAVVNGKIYILGGHGPGTGWFREGIPSVAIYDPANDQWSRGADMPTPRGAVVAGAIDGYIYTVGGNNLELQNSNLVHRYDPVNDQWAQRASIPMNVTNGTASVINKALYVMGGFSVNNIAESTAIAYRYDPVTNQWSRLADMGEPRQSMASAALDGQIYVVGGRIFRNGGNLQSAELYTP